MWDSCYCFRTALQSVGKEKTFVRFAFTLSASQILFFQEMISFHPDEQVSSIFLHSAEFLHPFNHFLCHLRTQTRQVFSSERNLSCLWVPEARSTCLCDSRTITRVFRSSMASETRGLDSQVDSMQFYGDLLSEILGESAPSSKKLHLKQNAIEWFKTIVADAREVYDKVSTEKGRLPQ